MHRLWTNCNFSHFTPPFETQAPRCLTLVTILSCFDSYQCLYPLFNGANLRPILLPFASNRSAQTFLRVVLRAKRAGLASETCTLKRVN